MKILFLFFPYNNRIYIIIILNYNQSFNSFLYASSKQDLFVTFFNCLYVLLNVSGSIRNRCQRIFFSRSKFVSAFYNEKFKILKVSNSFIYQKDNLYTNKQTYIYIYIYICMFLFICIYSYIYILVYQSFFHLISYFR